MTFLYSWIKLYNTLLSIRKLHARMYFSSTCTDIHFFRILVQKPWQNLKKKIKWHFGEFNLNLSIWEIEYLRCNRVNALSTPKVSVGWRLSPPSPLFCAEIDTICIGIVQHATFNLLPTLRNPNNHGAIVKYTTPSQVHTIEIHKRQSILNQTDSVNRCLILVRLQKRLIKALPLILSLPYRIVKLSFRWM